MEVPSDLDISQFLDRKSETEEGPLIHGLPLNWKQFCKVSSPGTAYSNGFPFSPIQRHVPYEGWFNMISTKDLVPSQCKMPATWEKFSLQLWNDKDTKCLGNIFQDNLGFSLNITGCEKNKNANDSKIIIEENVYEFDCLASFNDAQDSKGDYNLFTIAKSKNGAEFVGQQTFCWIFHYTDNLPKDKFYIVQPGACDNRVIDDVMKGRSPDDVIIAEMTSQDVMETVEEVSSNAGSVLSHVTSIVTMLCIISYLFHPYV